MNIIYFLVKPQPNLSLFWQNIFFHIWTLRGSLKHNHKKRKYSLETPSERAVLPSYVENCVILKPILLYRASKYKQMKSLGYYNCLWPPIFPSCVIYISVLSFLCQNTNMPGSNFAKKAATLWENKVVPYQTQNGGPNY